MISKNYSKILVGQLFLNTLLLPTAVDYSKKIDLHLKDADLFVETFSGFPACYWKLP